MANYGNWDHAPLRRAEKEGGLTGIVRPIGPFSLSLSLSIAHLISVFGQRNHVREEHEGDWVPLPPQAMPLRFSPTDFFCQAACVCRLSRKMWGREDMSPISGGKTAGG